VPHTYCSRPTLTHAPTVLHNTQRFKNSEPGLAGCLIDCPFHFHLFLSGQTKTLHILFNTTLTCPSQTEEGNGGQGYLIDAEFLWPDALAAANKCWQYSMDLILSSTHQTPATWNISQNICGYLISTLSSFNCHSILRQLSDVSRLPMFYFVQRSCKIVLTLDVAKHVAMNAR